MQPLKSCQTALLLITTLYSIIIANPKIIGVTNNSIYTRIASNDCIQPFWFNESVIGSLSIDGGNLTLCDSRKRLTKKGVYKIVLSEAATNQKTTVNFTIDPSSTSGKLFTNSSISGCSIEITFKQGKYFGKYRPVMVMWVENLKGDHLQNLYVSHMVATGFPRYGTSQQKSFNGAPYWRSKACIGSSNGYVDPITPIPSDLDAVTGATEYSAFELHTNINTQIAKNDSVRILFEINQSFDKYTGGFFGTKEEPAIIYAITIPLTHKATYSLAKYNTQVGNEEVKPGGYLGYFSGNKLDTNFYSDNKSKFHHANKMVKEINIKIKPSQAGTIKKKDKIYDNILWWTNSNNSGYIKNINYLNDNIVLYTTSGRIIWTSSLSNNKTRINIPENIIPGVYIFNFKKTGTKQRILIKR